MTAQLPKAEDGTIIPPTKEEMAVFIVGSICKTGALDDEGMRKLQGVVVQMLNRFDEYIGERGYKNDLGTRR